MWKLGVKSPGVYLQQFSDFNKAGLNLVPPDKTREEVCRSMARGVGVGGSLLLGACPRRNPPLKYPPS